MLNLNTLFFFTLVFTLFVSLRGIGKIVGSLLNGEPLIISMSNKELIYFALSISYVITYIFNA
jgi:hypothetical protein